MGLFSRNKNYKKAEIYATTWLKQLYETTELVNNTVNPDVFFTRYDFLIELLTNLKSIEHLIDFKNGSPRDLLHQANSKRVQEINNFIERYYMETLMSIEKLKTDKAKQRRIDDFYPTLSNFFHKMANENIVKVEELSNQLKNRYALPSTEVSGPPVPNPSTLKNLDPTEWYIMISFGSSNSKSLEKAVYLAQQSPKYYSLKGEEGNQTYTATYSCSKEDFLNFIVLYDLVGSWKSTIFVINGKVVDKKTIGKIKYCYGDKCRTVHPDFCYGASHMTENPFGCHRLQISKFNNPWWEYYKERGQHFELDRDALLEKIHLSADTFKHCPDFDLERILKVAMGFPLVVRKKELQQLINNERSNLARF